MVKVLKRWFRFPKAATARPVPPAKARTRARKSLVLHRSVIHSDRAAYHPAAAAAHGAALAEQGNLKTGREPVFFEIDQMKIQNQEAKEKLIQRLRRIEGQVRGVQSMLDEERDCREIMQQLAAVHSAMQGASRTFLQEYATACLVEMDETGQLESSSSLRQKREKIIQDMIALLDKAP